MGAALILTALGVERSQVVHDYSLSETFVDYMADYSSPKNGDSESLMQLSHNCRRRCCVPCFAPTLATLRPRLPQSPNSLAQSMPTLRTSFRYQINSC